VWLNLSGSGGVLRIIAPNREIDHGMWTSATPLIEGSGESCRLTDVCKAIMAIISQSLQHEHASHSVDGSAEVRGSRK
jgi:hypothetical protein